MSLGRSAVLAVTRIAPILASANCSTIHSGTLVAQSTTRSPAPTPCAISPRATRRASASSSANVYRGPFSYDNAGRVGSARASRASKSPTVTSRNGGFVGCRMQKNAPVPGFAQVRLAWADADPPCPLRRQVPHPGSGTQQRRMSPNLVALMTRMSRSAASAGRCKLRS